MPDEEPAIRVLLVERTPPAAPCVKSILPVWQGAGILSAVVRVAPDEVIHHLCADYDLVLWHRGPGADGAEALRAFRREAPGVPILALLEADDEESALQSLTLGADEALCVDEASPESVRRTFARAGARAESRARNQAHPVAERADADSGAKLTLRIRIMHDQALLQLSRRLERAEDHAAILAAAREAILATLGMGRIWFYQLSADGEYLHLILEDEGGKPLEQQGEGRKLRVAGDAMLEEIVAGKDVVVVEDAQTDPRTNKEIVRALGNRTIVNIPIILAGRKLGSLGTGTFGEEGVRPLSAEEREFLAALGSHVAAVLDRVTAAKERDLAEAALRKSEVQFRQLVEALPLLVWTCTATGECDYLSHQWVEYTGIPAELQLGQGWSEQIHPDDRSRVHETWLTAMSSGSDFQCEFRIRRADGQYRWFDTRAARIRDDQGLTQRWVGSNIDIDESKEVAAHRERLARLIEQSRDFIAIADLDGRLNYLNAGGRQIIGLGPDQSPSQLTLWDLAVDPGKAGSRQTISRSLCETDLWEGTTQLKNLRSGESADVFRSVSLIRDPNTQEPWCYAIVMHDITTGKRAEDALKLFRLLIDQSTDAFEVIDPVTGRFLDANERGHSDVGYTREELLTLRVCDIDPTVTPEEWPGRMEGIRKVKRAMVEGIHRRKDGSTFPVEVNIRWVELDRPYLVTVARDVSERKQLEEQFRQSQKMEAIGQLAGGVAHDFNNLLCVITGYADLSLMCLPPGEPMRKMLTDIRAAGEQATRLTRQLLAFSRQQVLAPTVLDLNEAVAEVRNMLQRLIGEDILLTTRLAPDLCPVKVDAGQINQVIVNLAVNARDAMPNGGQLTLATRNVDRLVETETAPGEAHVEKWVSLSITDTGEGMTPEVKSRIFEPFFTTKGVGQGTGLGLSVVHGIVKQSEGEIEVDSEEGNGTTIRILLPAVTEALPPPVEERAHPPGGGTETILLVEDDDLVRTFAAHALEPFGYTVLKATDGAEALQIAAAQPGKIHLLVTDVVMPGMNGRMVAEALQQQDPSLKVLFLSGYTDDDVMRHGICQAEVSFLQKPVSPRVLAAKVRELLDLPSSGAPE